MKFYNPFKLHIAKFCNGKYAARRWQFPGWQYLDLETNHSFLSKESMFMTKDCLGELKEIGNSIDKYLAYNKCQKAKERLDKDTGTLYDTL